MSLAVVAGVLAVPSQAVTVSNPCGLFDAATRTDPVLGDGLTLTTGAAANFFPAGSRPTVTLTGTPGRPGAVLSWTVRNRTRALTRGAVTLGTADVPLSLPAAVPGMYEVEAHLSDGGLETGATCLRYGVGMPGAKLNLAALPAGKDWGGPAANRDVQLHKMLGLSAVRRGLDFGRFVSDPTYTDAEFLAAAAAARARNVAFVVQIGQGGAAEKAAIANGTWERVVGQAVAHFRGVVPYWEAWNEPNSSFYPGGPADFVRRTLVPFARAVHANDRAARVVGGSAYGTDSDWWTAFGRAGGFKAVDIVAVHAYSWSRSWESANMGPNLATLKKLAASMGGAGKPLWDTESGFKSITNWGGPFKQADWSTRRNLWERTLGMRGSQFLLEGGWEDWAVIDQYRGVKAAALALSTQDTLLDGRRFLRWEKAPAGVWAASFLAPNRSVVTAVWTNDTRRGVRLATAHTAWDETGARYTARGTIVATGAVTYLASTYGRPAL